MSEEFDYYYGEESESCSFYRIPRLVVLGARFSGLSTDAKLLYGLMLDRMNLSARNGWYDGAGRVYIYYTLEEIQESLRCGHGKAVRLLAELDTEKGIGLIERKKQGQGKPTRIYVKRYTTRAVPPPADFPGEEVKTSENGKSRVPQSGRADFPKGDGNYTDRKQTDVNQLYRSSSSPPGGGRWERERMTEKVRSQVEYGRLCERYEVELIDELVAVITDVLCSTRPTLRVGGELLPAWQVQKRFRLISTYSQRESGQYKVGALYGFADDAVLQAIGLTKADAYKRGNGVFYFTSDKLNKALADALAANATTVKNALETAARNGGNALPETDASGHSKVSGLEQGLYLAVETRVPENVTSTCNPFFVSLPMTTIDGKDWNYDVTVYPKNQTGNPTLEKTVREDKNSTGKNTGSLTDIADGYAHTATASVGDVVEYQIISTLPTITSKATSLTTYTFVDTLSEGIRYNKNDVVIRFYKDAGCKNLITTWDEDSGKFSVAYDNAQNAMTIGMTKAGLADINESASVYTDSVKRGYSDCTMRITYAATLTADAQLGDSDNPNEVVLTWKRTNTGYFDTLQDCCHVYTYGVDVLKQFSDGKGDLTNVNFLLHNDTDGYFVTAKLVDGVYYVTGHEAKESKATAFVPNGEGHIRVMGLEDDTYTLTETDTDKGYVLLKDGIEIVITAAEGESACETCGVKLLTASGSVNGDAVDMEDGNAIVPLTVINNPGFDLPKTGGYGTWMFTVGGCMLLGVAVFIVIRGRKHNRNDQ